MFFRGNPKNYLTEMQVFIEDGSRMPERESHRDGLGNISTTGSVGIGLVPRLIMCTMMSWAKRW